MNKIIKNNSKGYGYNYASLPDIVKQGYELPKMKTGSENGKDYIYYKDEEGWQRGAEIVIPENVISKEGKPKMNKAQLYMSAITYAKRSTALMALQLATDDDVEIENAQEVISKTKEFEKYYTKEEINTILANYKINDVSELDQEVYDKYINYKRYGKKQNAGK